MMRVFITAVILSGFAGCANPSVQSGSSNELSGTWKMTEHYFDIGDGNGQWWKADSAKQSILVFSGDKIIRNSNDTVRYRITDDKSFYQYQLNGDSIRIQYEFRGDTLELRPPCIEGCGERYIRVDKN